VCDFRFKLATLTRGGEESPTTQQHTTPQFDTSAVPTDPAAFNQHVQQLQRAQQADLIDLGEEPLFSGRAPSQRERQQQPIASASAQALAQEVDGVDGGKAEADGLLGTPVVTEVRCEL